MKKTIAHLLIFLMVYPPLAQAQTQRPTVEEARKDQEEINRQAVALPINPWLWTEAGRDSYIPGGVGTREEMAQRIREKDSFVDDLVNLVKLTRPAAEYAREKFLHAADPDSEVGEVILSEGDFIEKMLIGSPVAKVVPWVKVMVELPFFGGVGNTWSLTLPARFGNIQLLTPKKCFNLGRNPKPVSFETIKIEAGAPGRLRPRGSALLRPLGEEVTTTPIPVVIPETPPKKRRRGLLFGILTLVGGGILAAALVGGGAHKGGEGRDRATSPP